MNKDAIIKVDVMIGDRFYLTFRYKHPRIFILNDEGHYRICRGALSIDSR